MDRFTSMSVFVKAVEFGSFASTADAFEITGPMVGKHIKALEERLGTRLLHRTTRRQGLTEFGKAYYERCKLILAEMDAADALAENETSELRGRLRVTMPIHFGRMCAAPVLLELARRFPALELDLAFSDHLSDLTEDGFDLAIRTGGLADRSDYLTRRLSTQRMIVVASPDYLETNGVPKQLGDLERHATLAYRRSGRVPPWLFPRQGGSPVRIMPNARWRFGDLDAIAAAAVAGMGLAWLPSWLVRERLKNGQLVKVLDDEGHFPYEVHALWVRTPYLPARIRAAIDELVKMLPGLM